MTASSRSLSQILDAADGQLCLDFVNSVDWRTSDHPQDSLIDFDALVAWAVKAGLFSSDEAIILGKQGADNPNESRNALERAVMFREVLYRLLVSAATGSPPLQSDLAYFNDMMPRALGHVRMTTDGDRFRLNWMSEALTVEHALWRVAVSAAALMCSGAIGYLRTCEGSGCGWLFVDTSKNHRRRWCDMKGCGNREKARRHYASVRSRRHSA